MPESGSGWHPFENTRATLQDLQRLNEDLDELGHIHQLENLANGQRFDSKQLNQPRLPNLRELMQMTIIKAVGAPRSPPQEPTCGAAGAPRAAPHPRSAAVRTGRVAR